MYSLIYPEILHNLEKLYDYAANEEITPEFENAVTSAMDHLDNLKAEAPVSTHDKIDRLRLLLGYLKGTVGEI